MKKLSIVGILVGAAFLASAPFSLQWSQSNVVLSLDTADARVGRLQRALRVSTEEFTDAHIVGHITIDSAPRVGARRHENFARTGEGRGLGSPRTSPSQAGASPTSICHAWLTLA